MATHNQGGLISIIEKHTFMNNLPAGWTREPKDGQGGSGSMKTTEGGEFTVLVQGSDFQGRDNLFEINDADDLQAAREVIMRGPILTTVKCTKTYWTSSDEDSDREEEREYVVLLNTGNPRISSEIERAFELAERLTREGRNFRITISISESLKRYYNVNVKVPDDSHNAKAEFCDIYLTRGVNRPNCADSFFIYDSAAEICVWILCLPVCLISGFPYLCYKKCYKGIVEKSFLNQALPIVAYTGPLQAGYNLRSLLHSPAGI